MERLHARYPFLSAAREAVQAAEVDLVDVVEAGGPPVERARERVARAIEDGTVGEMAGDSRAELLSYPVARVLVSLVEERVLTGRYAHAEAATAFERLEADLQSADRTADPYESARRRPGRGGRDGPSITVADMLADLDLAADVEETGEGHRVRVAAFVSLAADIRGEEWRLVNRSLADGSVPVTDAELRRLLQQAVHERVAAGLPLEVPEAVAAPLEPVAEDVREQLSALDLTREIDTVVPELFPPCMQHLLDRVQAGDHLEHHSRFAVTAFLAAIGLSTDEIVDLYRVNPGFGEEVTRYQTDHIRGETSPTEYDPPSCATMKSYGDCVNMDDLCERIAHPMGYYEARLEDAEEEDLEDWREREAAQDS
jgi:DNA primase large subunit